MREHTASSGTPTVETISRPLRVRLKSQSLSVPTTPRSAAINNSSSDIVVNTASGVHFRSVSRQWNDQQFITFHGKPAKKPGGEEQP